MPKMLIADGEPGIRQYIRQYAEYEGYTVTEAQDGEQAVDLCRKMSFDVIIMELSLSPLSGLDALREIRTFSRTPVIICSARSDESDRLSSFSQGADDFVTKPFSPRELMMRVSAIRRRTESTTASQQSTRFTYKGLVIDFAARKVTIDDQLINLSPKECDLLFFLVRNHDVALSRDTLISEIWGSDFPGDERTLDTHIKLLRRKLGEYARLIVTIRGVGYRFEG